MNDDKLRWQLLASEEGARIPLFRVRLDTLRHPVNSTEFQRLVLEAPDWVNVVAVTAGGRVVMVEQYRFGVSELTIEPVGGIVDEGEDSLTAGKRELLEETGYAGGQWRYLGSVQANPAIHNNVCHHWLAEGVKLTQEPRPDPGECIRVELMDLDGIRRAIRSARLRHSLGLSALSRVFPLWELPHIQGQD